MRTHAFIGFAQVQLFVIIQLAIDASSPCRGKAGTGGERPGYRHGRSGFLPLHPIKTREGRLWSSSCKEGRISGAIACARIVG